MNCELLRNEAQVHEVHEQVYKSETASELKRIILLR